MAIKKFEDIIGWQKAQDLAVEVYKLFKDSRDFGFKDQICRASVSISNNIAEGFERNTKKDFARFLDIALGSTSEVKSMVYLAHRLDYIEKLKQEELVNSTTEISKIIQGLLKTLR